MINYVDDGRVWCVYNIEDTSSSTTILASTSSFSDMEVDGATATLATTFLFSATGEHIIKFTPKTNGIGGLAVSALKECYLPSVVTSLGNRCFRYGGIESVYGLEHITYMDNEVFQATPLAGDINLPSIETMGSNAFNGARISSVTIGDKLSVINGSSFSDNSYLKKVTLGSGITSINNMAFRRSGVTTVTITATTPPSVSSNFFENCPIAAIYVPKNSLDSYKAATYWSGYASKMFPLWDSVPINIVNLSDGRWRRRLMIGASTPSRPYPDPWVDDGKIWCYYNVTTTESATSLGTNCNRAASMEVDGVSVTPSNSYTFDTIGEHLVKFSPGSNYGRYFFTNSKALVRCYLPTTITRIYEQNFSSCSNLTLLNFKSLSITALDNQALNGCSKLVMEELSLPYLTSYGSNALSGCAKLISIVDLGSITSVGGYAFNGCSSLVSVVLPATLTSIGNYCFPTKTKTFTLLATTPPSLGTGAFLSTPTVIYVPAESVETYKAASGWSNYANKIQAIPE